MRYLDDRRPVASSGATGPSSSRDRPVDLEVITGSLGCGDLVYELKSQFERARPGQAVRVVSDDPGAGMEIPAWCRLTGRELLAADHPYYIIRNQNGIDGQDSDGGRDIGR